MRRRHLRVDGDSFPQCPIRGGEELVVVVRRTVCSPRESPRWRPCMASVILRCEVGRLSGAQEM